MTDHRTCGCGAIVLLGRACPRCGQADIEPGDFMLRPVTDAEIRQRRREARWR